MMMKMKQRGKILVVDDSEDMRFLVSSLLKSIGHDAIQAVDGVSLTVVEAGPDWFTVSLIPETLARTTLGHREVGEPVNLEFDVIGKYVERLLAVRGLLQPIPQEPR